MSNDKDGDNLPEGSPIYFITRHLSGVVVTPDTKEVRRLMTLVWRKFDVCPRTRQRKFFPKRTRLYKPSEMPGKLLGLRGAWAILLEKLQGRGKLVKIIDEREEFPRPNLQSALSILRPYQKGPAMQFLMAEDSGMKGAVTRWGKTYDMASIILAYRGLRVIVAAPGIDLCEQLQKDLTDILKPAKIGVVGIYTGSGNKTQGADVTVCCAESMHNCDPDSTRIVICDETHAWASETYVKFLLRFGNARLFGMGATLDGRPDKRDAILPFLFGPVWSNVPYLKAVEVGAVSPIHVILYDIKLNRNDIMNAGLSRDTAYKRLLKQSIRMASTLKRMITECIPKDWQTMIFIDDEKQADFLMQQALEAAGVVAMAKKLSPKERKKLTREIALARHTRVIASSIYIQGVTFPDLRVLINMSGGGRNTGTIQRPGRTLQKRDGKNYGVMIDVVFSVDADARDMTGDWWCLVRDSIARERAYTDIGYMMSKTSDLDEVTRIVKGAYGSETTPKEIAGPVAPAEKRNSKAPRVVAPSD